MPLSSWRQTTTEALWYHTQSRRQHTYTRCQCDSVNSGRQNTLSHIHVYDGVCTTIALGLDVEIHAGDSVWTIFSAVLVLTGTATRLDFVEWMHWRRPHCVTCAEQNTVRYVRRKNNLPFVIGCVSPCSRCHSKSYEISSAETSGSFYANIGAIIWRWLWWPIVHRLQTIQTTVRKRFAPKSIRTDGWPSSTSNDVVVCDKPHPSAPILMT